MKTLPDSYGTVSDLDAFHIWTDHMFEKHQIALMDGRPQHAAAILKRLGRLMLIHIEDEETLLLPPYAERVRPVPAGGAVAFYQREHQQILGFLRRFIEHQPGGPDELSIVHYFDISVMYRDLIEHHHARERSFLYRTLDARLSEAEKTAILNTFAEHQRNAG